MKVYENQSQILPTSPKKANKNGIKGAEFQQIMEKLQEGAINKGVTSDPNPIGLPPQGIQILQGAEKMTQVSQGSGQQMVLDELKSTIDLIDFYAAKLGDTDLSIKGFTPLVDHLDNHLANLRQMESDPNLPQKLRPVLGDVVVTLGTELAKFKRGDYA